MAFDHEPFNMISFCPAYPFQDFIDAHADSFSSVKSNGE